MLIKDAGHGNVNLVRDLCDGFDLTGPLPEPNVFSRRVRPAVMTCNELRHVAELSRTGLVESIRSSGDTELDQQSAA